jgi:hypothetical protein
MPPASMPNTPICTSHHAMARVMSPPIQSLELSLSVQGTARWPCLQANCQVQTINTQTGKNYSKMEPEASSGLFWTFTHAKKFFYSNSGSFCFCAKHIQAAQQQLALNRFKLKIQAAGPTAGN